MLEYVGALLPISEANFDDSLLVEFYRLVEAFPHPPNNRTSFYCICFFGTETKVGEDPWIRSSFVGFQSLNFLEKGHPAVAQFFLNMLSKIRDEQRQ